MKYKTPGVLFRWSPSMDTWMASISVISVVMINTFGRSLFPRSSLHVLIWELLVTVCIGVLWPLYWMVIVRGKGTGALGITDQNWTKSLLVGLLLAGISFWIYKKGYTHGFEGSDMDFPVWVLGFSFLWAIIFIFGWVQLRLEEAFGLIPSILLAGLCYSLLNLGAGWFSTHFFKAFLIQGLLCACIFRLTKNILILWPFAFSVILLYHSDEILGLLLTGGPGYTTVSLALVVIAVIIFLFVQRISMKRFPKIFLAGLFLIAVLTHGYFFQKGLHILTGYKAKTLCSGVFVSKRNPDSVNKEDIWLGRDFDAEINFKNKSVRVSWLGIAARKAIFRPGLGCTLVIGTPEEEILKQSADASPPFPVNASLPWPEGDFAPITELPSSINRQRLARAIQDAFKEPNPQRPRRNTRAIVVVYDGRIIAERYAPGFSKDTPLHGFSMTKSVTSALVGILVGQGKLSITAPAPVPSWKKAGDERGKITLDQLLRMGSGLKFDEYYTNLFSDVWTLMYGCGDTANYAINKSLEANPGTKWHYSTGTTNIISRIIRDTLGGTYNDYLAFPKRALFNRIGMRSAIMELDSSGTVFGGAFMYATARDWARFGLLYLQDGVWKGERILPRGWVKYTTTPKTPVPHGVYGAQFWLNAGKTTSLEKLTWEWMPGLPNDLYSANGAHGQFVTIIPSQKMVLVRLASSRGSLRKMVLDWTEDIKSILASISG